MPATSKEPPVRRLTIGLSPEKVALMEQFYGVRVRHPKLDAVLDDLDTLLTPHTESNIIFLTGATGSGKSTLTRVLLRTLVETFRDVVDQDVSTVPLVSVEAYADGDTKFSFAGLYTLLLEELKEPLIGRKGAAELEDGHLTFNRKRPPGVRALRQSLKVALHRRKTRILVIDEAYFLLRWGNLTTIADTLRSMVNTTETKIVLVGSYDLFDLAISLAQTARRTAILNLDHFHRGNSEDEEVFRKVVAALQAKWPCDIVPNFVAIADELLEISLGCIGLLKTFLLEALALQLKADGRWEPKFLQKAAKANKLREVIRKEIEAGEAKIQHGLVGQSLWDDPMIATLAQKMRDVHAAI